MRRFLKDNGLTLATLALFLASLAGQLLTGHRVQAQEALDHGRPPTAFGDYLTSGHFFEALFENWQSEFLAVLAIVVLSIFLRQKGSPESKPVHAPTAQTGAG